MNATSKVIDIVDSKYSDNVVLVSMVDNLKYSQLQALTAKDGSRLMLDGYRAGAQGTDGYHSLGAIPGSLFDGALRECSYLYKVSIITSLLVEALERLGEEIEH